MPEFIGRQVEIGVGLEAERGTPATAVARWIKKADATVVERADKAIDPSTRGRLEDSLGTRVTRKWIEGNIDGVLHADAVGYFLASLYGGVTSTPLTAGAHSHAFAVDQTIQHPTLTLFVKEGAVTQSAFTNCVVGELAITAAIDDYVRTSVSVTGREAVADASAPSYGTEYDFVARDITIKMADTQAGLAAATAIPATDAEIVISQGVIPNHVIGAYEPDDVFNAQHSVEVTFSRAFADETLKDLFMTDGYRYAQIKIEGVADVGGGAHPTLTITLHRAALTEWDRQGGSDELVTEPVTLKGFFNETDGKATTVTLVNRTASYEAEAEE